VFVVVNTITPRVPFTRRINGKTQGNTIFILFNSNGNIAHIQYGDMHLLVTIATIYIYIDDFCENVDGLNVSQHEYATSLVQLEICFAARRQYIYIIWYLFPGDVNNNQQVYYIILYNRRYIGFMSSK
jgi:hypothetical protein